MKGSHPNLPPLVADVFVYADLLIKQPELIMLGDSLVPS